MLTVHRLNFCNYESSRCPLLGEVGVVLQDPGMPEHILQRQPLLRALPQQPGDQVPRGARHVAREPQVDVDDPLVGVLVGLGLERRFPHQELVGEDPQSPMVHTLVVGVTLPSK